MAEEVVSGPPPVVPPRARTKQVQNHADFAHDCFTLEGARDQPGYLKGVRVKTDEEEKQSTRRASAGGARRRSRLFSLAIFKCLAPSVGGDGSAYGPPRADALSQRRETDAEERVALSSTVEEASGRNQPTPGPTVEQATRGRAMATSSVVAVPRRKVSLRRRLKSMSKSSLSSVQAEHVWMNLDLLHACTQPTTSAASSTNSSPASTLSASERSCTDLSGAASLRPKLARRTSMDRSEPAPAIDEKKLAEQERAIAAYLRDHMEGLKRSGSLPSSTGNGVSEGASAGAGLASSQANGRTFFGRVCERDDPASLNIDALSGKEREYMTEVVEHWQRLVVLALGNAEEFEASLQECEQNGKYYEPELRRKLTKSHRLVVDMLSARGGVRSPDETTTLGFAFPIPPWAILPLSIQVVNAPDGRAYERVSKGPKMVASSCNADVPADLDDNIPPPIPAKNFGQVPETSGAFKRASVHSQMEKGKWLRCETSKLLEDIRQLDNFGWYWGPVGRSAAEEKLTGLPKGTFIVRDCSDRHHLYCVSVVMGDRVGHILVKMNKGKYAWIDNAREEDTFDTLPELIDATTAASGWLHHGGGSIFMKKGLSRFERVPSLLHLCRFAIRRHTEINYDQIDDLPLPRIMKLYLQDGNIY